MTENTAFTVQTLMNTVAAMQESINALTLKLMKQDAKDKFDIPGAPGWRRRISRSLRPSTARASPTGARTSSLISVFVTAAGSPC